jgi:hypothetical protein
MWIHNVGDLAVSVWNTRVPYLVVLWSVKAVVIERNSNAALFLAAWTGTLHSRVATGLEIFK